MSSATKYKQITLHKVSIGSAEACLPVRKFLNCNADVSVPTKNAHDVLEERDPSYEEMLKHMVGRISTKPGGKPEMGEVSLLIPK